jgi:hypothetical protein
MKNHHMHHWHGYKAQINQLLSIIIYASIQTKQNGIYRGSGKERGRGFAELLHVDATVVTARRTARFLGAAVTTRRRGPGDGDGRADDAVPGCGGDGGGDGRGGNGVVPGIAVKAEEWDGNGGEGRAGRR